MKRLTRLCLLSALLVMALCFTALAAEPGIVEAKSELSGVAITANGDKATVTYSNAESGKYYMVFTLSDNSGVPNDSNLVYIDQKTAEGSTVEFVVYPKALENGKTYYVYLSSNSEDIGAMKLAATFKYQGSAAAVTKGDINGDGSIDAKDVAVLRRYLADKVKNALTAEGQLAADINGDSSIDAKDLGLLRRYLSDKVKYPLPA